MEQDQEKLDRILSNPDPLLVQSLRRDEKRRRRIVLGLSGGLIMLAIVSTVAVSLLTGGVAATPSQPVHRGAATAPKTNVALDPVRSNALSTEGWQLWQRRDMAAALEKFREAVKLDPKNANAWNGMGWVCFNSGSGDEAQKAWLRCLQLVPNHPAALNGLGQLALMRRQYGLAERYLLRAANFHATAAYWGLARVYLLQGKWQQAANWAQTIVTQEPNNPEAEQLLAAAKAKHLDPVLRQKIEPPPVASAETQKAPTPEEQAAPAPAKKDSGTSADALRDSFEAVIRSHQRGGSRVSLSQESATSGTGIAGLTAVPAFPSGRLPTGTFRLPSGATRWRTTARLRPLRSAPWSKQRT